MGRHGRPHHRRPTKDELTQATSVAWSLHGITSVTETELAVYVHGVEAWVCPHCLAINYVGDRMPLAPTSCKRCNVVLQP